MNRLYVAQIATHLLGGMTVALAAVAAIFFARFYRETADRLFLFFAWSFAIIAVNRAALSFFDENETRTYLYVVRFIGYLLILIGIYDKNRRAARSAREGAAAARLHGPASG